MPHACRMLNTAMLKELRGREGDHCHCPVARSVVALSRHGMAAEQEQEPQVGLALWGQRVDL